MDCTRRSFVACFGVLATGCLGDEEESETRKDGNEEGGTGDRGTTDEDDGELDLREANVVGVSVEGDEGTYTFDVTLYHDDAGEDGYADRWVVESLDGRELGRRNLAHPHGTQRFTRSTTVATDENCVAVRGHDQTHGYGGRAVVVDLETGETRGFVQGENPSSFDEEDCP